MYLSYDIDMKTEIIISICKSYESEEMNIIIKMLTLNIRCIIINI